jgi:predicted nucleic acid-binding protein
MTKVFWDTNLFIYMLEDNPRYADRVSLVRTQMKKRGHELFTSALTVGEVLVHPIRKGDLGMAKDYERIFHASDIQVIPFGQGTATFFARIRAEENVSPPDAIQLSCAASERVDLFITNDERLARIQVQGIQFITSLARAPY